MSIKINPEWFTIEWRDPAQLTANPYQGVHPVPSLPQHKCNYPGCHLDTVARYCPTHALAAQHAWRERQAPRPTPSARGYGWRWRKASKAYLAHHPQCVACLGPANLVDHVHRVEGPDDQRFWDQGNWQALCHPCHNRKTIREDGGMGHRKLFRQGADAKGEGG